MVLPFDGANADIDGMGRDEIEWRKKWLAFWLGHVTRVEPALGSSSGAPDVYLANGPFHVWVEFKFADEKGNFILRTPQKRWHSEFRKAGARHSVVVVMDAEGWWLFPSKVVIEGPGLDRNVYSLCGKKVTWRWLEGSEGPDHFALQDMLSLAVKANG